ncbi:hypothetical protein Tdes44962_MAKER06089 [Teratosphaeria destructans]|uniref:Uncharacterized protein n=1 Tax=Teratosphaeria destructans TaxID=418781 RepID=A0A9W7SI30_9PEZI|nr:hypothetical protein Tdes44962_MAKER06089 [Teratosphaeria destructans]
MTSSAFPLKGASLQDAVGSMSAHLSRKLFGRYTAAQLLQGGPGVSWIPSSDQTAILTKTCADFTLNHKSLPSSAQLASLLQPRQLDLFSGHRAFDRKMAVKVLRWIETHGSSTSRSKKPTASRSQIETLVDDALDLIEEARADQETWPPLSSSNISGQRAESEGAADTLMSGALPPGVQIKRSESQGPGIRVSPHLYDHSAFANLPSRLDPRHDEIAARINLCKILRSLNLLNPRTMTDQETIDKALEHARKGRARAQLWEKKERMILARLEELAAMGVKVEGLKGKERAF